MEQSVFLTKPNTHMGSSLLFNFCGVSRNQPAHSFGPAIRKSYILHVVLDGKGVYRVKDHQFSLRGGNLFLIRPGDSTFYIADRKDPWTYSWLCFSGPVADSIIRDSVFGEDQYIAFTSDTSAYVQIIQECLACDKDTILDDLHLTELTYRFLRTLLGDTLQKTDVPSRKLSGLTLQAISYIDAHYAEELTVQKIADHLTVHRSHLSRCFKKDTDCSLQRWLLTVRVNAAAFLLSGTDETVSDIAFSTGFQSLVSFSRAFKNLTGESPSAYRYRCLTTAFEPSTQAMIMTQIEGRPLASRST